MKSPRLLKQLLAVFLVGMTGCAWIQSHQTQIISTLEIVGNRVAIVATQTLLNAAESEADANFKANFADAIALPGNSGSRTGSRTLYASFETGEPQCGYPTTINTVWFKWTCISTGTFTISTLGSRNGNGTEWDAVLGIYTGTTLADLALVPDLYCPANDYNNTPGPSSNPQDTGSYETTQFAVTAGATYYFQMGGDGGGGPNFPDDALNIVLNWSFMGSGGGNTYADWVGADGGTADQDSNHDGVPNGIAYFMGEHGLITLPGVDTNNTITWKMNATFSGTYEIQTSTDLKTWTAVAAQPTPADGNLSYTLPKAAEGGKLFVRLAVSPN